MDPLASVAKAFTAQAFEALEKYGPLYVDKLGKDPEEAKKHCRVCGERIKGGVKFHLTRRFYCVKCGHRTHYHCAGDVPGRLCSGCK